MFTIKNVSPNPLPIDGVLIEPNEQLGHISNLSPDMLAARDAGHLQIKDETETLEERKADVAALKPFKVGDPAIDG